MLLTHLMTHIKNIFYIQNIYIIIYVLIRNPHNIYIYNLIIHTHIDTHIHKHTVNYPLLIKLDVTLMAWNLDDVMWPLSDVFASRAPAEESGRGGHWMPNWCCRQCFRENIGLCCGWTW